MYGISEYTGDSAFWNSSHSLQIEYLELYKKLVPLSGEANTDHGELLRMISRLSYDIFNNGLCNDKREEIKYLLENLEKYQKFLEFQRSPSILPTLMDVIEELTEEDEDWDRSNGIPADQKFCNALDDITQAIVRYCMEQEAADNIEVRWKKMYGSEIYAVEGRIDGVQEIVIYNDHIHMSSALAGDLAKAKQTIECHSRAIALYEAGVQ
jgi:hypothetical protein